MMMSQDMGIKGHAFQTAIFDLPSWICWFTFEGSQISKRTSRNSKELQTSNPQKIYNAMWLNVVFTVLW